MKSFLQTENEIQHCRNNSELPRLCIEFADTLILANTTKATIYIEKALGCESIQTQYEWLCKAYILKVAIAMNNMDIQTAEQHIELALKLAEEHQLRELSHLAKVHQAIVFLYSGKSDESKQIIDDCLLQSETINDSNVVFDTFCYAAFVYMEKDMVKAGECAFKALEKARESDVKSKIGYAHAILGYWARENKVEEDTYTHFKEAATYLNDGETDEYYANVLIQLSVCEKDNGNFDTALSLLEEAQTFLHKVNNNRLIVLNAISLGRLYRAQKQYKKAQTYYIEAHQISLQHNNRHEAAVSAVFLGHLHRDLEQFDKSIEWFEKGISILGDNVRPATKADISKHLHSIYYKNGKLEKAYNTLLDYVEIRLKIQDENRIKETAQLQAKYETKKREAELREARLKQTESELKALKAQMNPHFIFNALNSIQEIFFLGDKRLANKHLSQFSQLTRKILHASGSAYISLHEEIEMLGQYLALETLRFSDNFSYRLNVKNSIDTYTTELPPLLIQPYIENAIKHGLMHKECDRKLFVDFQLNEDKDSLLVTIEDNGIGRAAAEKINAQKERIGKSFAANATAQRLSLLNENSQQTSTVIYHDLYNGEQAAGTRVEITIPVKL